MSIAALNVDSNRMSQMVDRCLVRAVQERASDIHFEPRENRLRVRFRIDGVLTERPGFPGEGVTAVVSRLKVLAGMDISERRMPQDGGFNFTKGMIGANFRISTFPTELGEKVVLRVLNAEKGNLTLDRLGMEEKMAERLRGLIRKPNGIILSTGPTGSGKTSSLYALLREFDADTVNIVTLEDPIEYRLPGITQGQTNARVGFTFAAGLRSILRQDPDVIMVGEMRDAETSQIAFRAALTGHMVLSTLHTNSAMESIVRLIDMGTERFVVAAALRAVVSQRLVRKVCGACRVPARLPAAFAQKLQVSRTTMIYRAKGCPQCAMTGYMGRTGVFEMIELDEGLSDLLKSPRTARMELARALAERGVVSLKRAGMSRVLKGETTIEEILRVS